MAFFLLAAMVASTPSFASKPAWRRSIAAKVSSVAVTARSYCDDRAGSVSSSGGRPRSLRRSFTMFCALRLRLLSMSLTRRRIPNLPSSCEATSSNSCEGLRAFGLPAAPQVAMHVEYFLLRR